MAEKEVVVKLSAQSDTSGTQKATGEMKKFATATDTAEKLTKKLVGTGAAVALAYKGIKASVDFFTSALKDSIMANEEMAAKVKGISDQWGKFKSYVGDTLSSFVQQTGVLDHMGEIVTLLANSFNWVLNTIKLVGNGLLSYILYPLEKILKVASYFSDAAKDAYNIVKDMRDGFNDSAISAAKSYEWNSKILDTQKDNAKTLKEAEELAKKKAEAEKRAKEEIERQNKALEEYKRKLNESSMERTVEFTAKVSTSAKDNDIEAYVNTDRELEEQKALNDAILAQKEEMYANDVVRYQEVLAEKEVLEAEYNQKRLALDQAYMVQNNEALKAYKATQTATYKQAFGTISEVAKLAQSENKKLAQVAKAAAIGEAIMNTYQGATKALAQGGFWGIAMAAAVVANGLASVDKIRATALAKGGVVEATPGGVPALIAEGGGDEAVLPLENPQAMARVGQAIGEAGGVGGAGTIININLSATGGLVPFLSELTEATRAGVTEALQYANISYKTGASENGVAV